MAVMLRADLRAAGLPDEYEGYPYTAHATRRSLATWLAQAGVAEGTIKRLMGHAGSGVTQRHYTAQTIAMLQAAVQSIHLDLSTGEVVALPMRALAGTDRHSKADGLTAGFTATLTAGRCKRGGESSMISLERDTGLEPATFGLGRLATIMHQGARTSTRWKTSGITGWGRVHSVAPSVHRGTIAVSSEACPR
jgi:hypothetical protein